MIDSVLRLGLNDKAPSFIKGYNDFHQFHRETTSLTINRNAGYQPPPGEEEAKKYAAGWEQAKREIEQIEEEQRPTGFAPAL